MKTTLNGHIREGGFDMTGWNLPPGCNVSDIPGNGPEDGKLEAAEEALMDTLCKINARPEEYAIVISVAVSAITAHREALKAARNEWAADSAMEREALEDGYILEEEKLKEELKILRRAHENCDRNQKRFR